MEMYKLKHTESTITQGNFQSPPSMWHCHVFFWERAGDLCQLLWYVFTESVEV